jgi:UDP-glucose 4-epimerase
MKILVIGGAGYIGSITTKTLVANGHSVIVLDNLAHGHRDAVPLEAEFIHGDMEDTTKLDVIFHQNKIDMVMHFAAHSLVAESIRSPSKYFSNNVVKGIKLLDTMIKNGIKRFIFSSSAAVYGEADCPVAEDAPLNPSNTYGHTKLAFERILECYDTAYGLRYISLRYFNAAGSAGLISEQHDPETHLIPLVLQVASGKRSSITIFGDDYNTSDGTAIRDYIHVEDLAIAHVAASEYLIEENKSNVFNLGSQKGYSVLQVIQAARQITACSIPVLIGARRVGDSPILIANNEKAKRVLNWKPRHTKIETIIESAWRPYLLLGENMHNFAPLNHKIILSLK